MQGSEVRFCSADSKNLSLISLAKSKLKVLNKTVVSRAVDGIRFLESNAFSIPGTYFRFLESRKHSIWNLLPSTALDPKIII